MGREQVLQIIPDLFERSCYELFERFKCTLTPLSGIDFDTSDVPTARIDAGNDDLELIIMLHVPFTALSMTYPLRFVVDTIDEAELEDWISELSNRVLGKLKTKLRSYDCHLNTSLPLYFFGTNDMDAPPQKCEKFTFHFELDSEYFEASLFIEIFNEEIQFLEVPIAPKAVDDGDIEYL